VLELGITRTQDELPAGTTTLDTVVLLVDVVLALVTASAALEMVRMSAMGGTLTPVHFTSLTDWR
jgi:hypothetical protein